MRRTSLWAAAGFTDTLIKWKMRPEVVHGDSVRSPARAMDDSRLKRARSPLSRVWLAKRISIYVLIAVMVRIL